MGGEPKPVPLSRPASELSDAELEAERERRRQRREARGVAPLPEIPAQTEGRVARALDAIKQQRDLAQHYANLELSSGAGRADVDQKYRELVLKYAPDKHIKNPERHRAALELVAQLTKSYEILLAALPA